MNWQHIYPLRDTIWDKLQGWIEKKHKTEGLDCDCNPKIDWDRMLVVHNSWDFREVKEELDETAYWNTYRRQVLKNLDTEELNGI